MADQAWRETFAQRVKNEKGKWVYRGFRWHGFSYNFVPSIDGEDAIEQYLNQAPSESIIFDEALSFCLKCDKVKPDLSIIESLKSLGYHDFYLSHPQMEWTLVLTHEAGLHGPFFCSKSLLETT